MVRRRSKLVLASGLALAAVVACSSFDGGPAATPDGGTDATPSPVDGSRPLDSSTGDSPTDAGPRCDPTSDFETPVLVPTLNAAPHHSLSARPAGDYLYFTSNRHVAVDAGFGDVDIYRARVFKDAFIDLQRLMGVSSPTEDVSPTESDDGLTLYLGVGALSVRRIKRSQRAMLTEPYPAPTDLVGDVIVPGAVEESDPYLVGTRLYFTSATDVKGDSSLVYSVEVDATGPIRPAVLVAGPFTGTVRYPVVNAAQKELHFMQYIGSAPPTPFVARRTTLADPFTNPTPRPLLAIANSENQLVTGLSADGCDLYLAARIGDAGFDIYRSRRGPPADH